MLLRRDVLCNTRDMKDYLQTRVSDDLAHRTREKLVQMLLLLWKAPTFTSLETILATALTQAEPLLSAGDPRECFAVLCRASQRVKLYFLARHAAAPQQEFLRLLSRQKELLADPKKGVISDKRKARYGERARQLFESAQAALGEGGAGHADAPPQPPPLHPNESQRPDMPRKPGGGFIHYCVVRRSELKKLHPSMPNTELTKAMGAEWRLADTEAKAYFDELASKDKARYAREKAAYDERCRALGLDPTPPKGSKKRKQAAIASATEKGDGKDEQNEGCVEVELQPDGGANGLGPAHGSPSKSQRVREETFSAALEP